MHEHIDEMGIINMNGRIYDPLIGRFMSADPYIQAPDDLQSHNRYAYVMNNPLNLTDPSGFSWLSKTWKKAWHNPIFKAFVGIAVAFYAPQLLATIFSSSAAMAAGSLANVIATGALSGFASTGTLKGALTGAFTAGLMYGVGTLGADLTKAGYSGFGDGGIGKIALHAGAGCLSSVAGGGSCKAGAISGGLGEFGHNIGTSGSFELGTIKAAMLGGIGSKLAGGKFADGAQTGAFGYMFNHMLHKSQVSGLFNSKGHHVFTKQWANDAEFKPLIHEDAIEFAGRTTEGSMIKWEGDHPNKWSNATGHPEYNNGSGRDVVVNFIKTNNITAENPMTVSQMGALIRELNAHPVNVNIRAYVREQVKNGNVLIGRSMGRPAYSQPAD